MHALVDNIHNKWFRHRNPAPIASKLTTNIMAKHSTKQSSANSTTTIATTSSVVGSRAAAELLRLVFCVAGIYFFFFAWALLQERITSAAYVTDDGTKLKFKAIAVRLIAPLQQRLPNWRNLQAVHLNFAFCVCMLPGAEPCASSVFSGHCSDCSQGWRLHTMPTEAPAVCEGCHLQHTGIPVWLYVKPTLPSTQQTHTSNSH